MKIHLAKVTNSIFFSLQLTKNINLFSKMPSRYFQKITQSIFNDDLTKMKISKDSQEFNKFSFIFDLKKQIQANKIEEWLKSADLESLSASIEFIGNVSQKYQEPIIDAKLYLTIIKKYYQIFDQKTNKFIQNIIINPNIELRYLIPTFIHTDKAQVSSLLKIKQIQILQFMSKSNTIMLQDFMRIISINIYNVSDWPLLKRFFYQYYYPRIGSVQTVSQLQKMLQYLGRFDAITTMIISKSATVMQQAVQKLIASGPKEISLEQFLSFAKCINLLLFKANANVNKVMNLYHHNELLLIYQHLMDMSILVEGLSFPAAEIYTERKVQQLIKHFQILVSRNIKEYQLTFSNSRIQEQCIVPFLVKNLMERDQRLTSICQSKQIVSSIQLQLLPTIIKALLSAAYINVIRTSVLKDFLKSSMFRQFTLKHPCYPDLYKDILVTVEELKSIHNINFHLDPQIVQEIGAFKTKIDYFLNYTIKNDDEAAIIQKYYSPRFIYRNYCREYYIWKLSESKLINKLHLSGQDYSFSNILGLLQNDNNFIYSRMRFNHKQLLQQYIRQQKKGSVGQFDSWSYPYFFVYIVPNRYNETFKFIMQNRFTQNSFQPKILDNTEIVIINNNKKMPQLQKFKKLI